MRLAFLFAVTLTLLTQASAARADAGPDDATKDAARKIAVEGLDLYDGGKYQDALDRFVRAESMVHAPTMALMAGRALIKLGRLVEAAEKLGAASQMQLEPGASDAFKQAVVDAGKELGSLLPRVPSVTITVDSDSKAEVSVKIDGQSLPASSLGQKKLLDPGSHTIVAAAGSLTDSQTVTLKEGESRPLRFDLKPASGSGLRTAGFVTLGAGAVGVIVGAVTGGLAVGKKGDLDKAGCGANHCPLGTAADVDAYNALLPASTAGFVAGGVLLATGAVLLIVAPSSKPKGTGAYLSPWVGFGSAGVRGAF